MSVAASPIRHLVFDKDGTLTDVHFYWGRVIRARAEALKAELRAPDVPATVLMAAMGIVGEPPRIREGGPVGYAPRASVVAAAAGALDEAGVACTAEQVNEIFAAVDATTLARIPEWTRTLDGVKPALGRLRDAGRTLSMLTSDRTPLARAAIQVVGLHEMFDIVIGGDQLTHQKPHPEGLLRILDELDADPSESAYVGDTMGDMETARAAGTRAIGVLTGLASRAELATVADDVIDTFGALPGLVGVS